MERNNIEAIKKQVVDQALELLDQKLRPYVLSELRAYYKDKWWQSGVETCLDPNVVRDARRKGNNEEQWFQELDLHDLLSIMSRRIAAVFRPQIGLEGEGYVKEALDTRIKWAHRKLNKLSLEDISRRLDTIARLLELIGGKKEAEQVQQLRQKLKSEDVISKEPKSQLAKRWAIRIGGLITAAIIVFLLISTLSSHFNNQALQKTIQKELSSLNSRIDSAVTITELEDLKEEINKKIPDATYKSYIDILTRMENKIEELKRKIERSQAETTVPPSPTKENEPSPTMIVQPPIPYIPSDPECVGLENSWWAPKKFTISIFSSGKFVVFSGGGKGLLCVRWDVTVEIEQKLGFRPPPVWKACWKAKVGPTFTCRTPQAPYNLFHIAGIEDGNPFGDSVDQARIMAGERIIRGLVWYYDYATGRWGRQVVEDN